MAGVLEREIQTFEQRRAEFARLHEGQFALVHGEDVEFFPTQVDALRVGYRRFGRDPFLVKQVEAHEEPARFASQLVRPPSAG